MDLFAVGRDDVDARIIDVNRIAVVSDDREPLVVGLEVRRRDLGDLRLRLGLAISRRGRDLDLGQVRVG